MCTEGTDGHVYSEESRDMCLLREEIENCLLRERWDR